MSLLTYNRVYKDLKANVTAEIISGGLFPALCWLLGDSRCSTSCCCHGATFDRAAGLLPRGCRQGLRGFADLYINNWSMRAHHYIGPRPRQSTVEEVPKEQQVKLRTGLNVGHSRSCMNKLLSKWLDGLLIDDNDLLEACKQTTTLTQ